MRSSDDANTPDDYPNVLLLHASPLAMLFDRRTLFVRKITLGNTEVLRGIYIAVRDQNWGTIPPRVTRMRYSLPGAPRRRNGELEPPTDRMPGVALALCASCYIDFDVDCIQGEIDFHWHGALWGFCDGTIEFTFEGEARSTFKRNRIGFCVLHPIAECAGARARFQTAAGQAQELRFPTTIEPQIFGKASFHDMRRLAHEVQPGLWAELEFSGDLFEMEDQRNWTDASFKTYCTPLALPFPVEVPAGTRIRQSVRLRFVDDSGAPLAHDLWSRRVFAPGTAAECRPPKVLHYLEPQFLTDGPNSVSVRELPTNPLFALPRLGLSTSREQPTLSQREIELLRRLPVSHLRADLDLGSQTWAADLAFAAGQADQLGSGLELILHVPPGSSCQPAVEHLQTLSVPLERILVFQKGESVTSRPVLSNARRHLAVLKVPIGAGSNAHFCELNRAQALGSVSLAEADFLAWPITPQVHAFDELSMAESVAAQADTLNTARRFAPDKPIYATPVTLKPRFNAVATTQGGGEPDRVPESVDRRQASLFCANWTLATILSLGSGGASAVTLFETIGWRGLMELESGPPMPELFPSTPGMLFPVYHVLRALASYTGFAPIKTNAPADVLTGACLFSEWGPKRLLLGNLSNRALNLELLFTPGPAKRILDSTILSQSAKDPDVFAEPGLLADQPPDYAREIELAPHALLVMDLW